eukprot:snap_masked-scaffold_6-processed-gene-10.28-mRNA-1 protein AED:0.24 eAED:0.24 QI:0/0/0/1/1/1/2/0/767
MDIEIVNDYTREQPSHGDALKVFIRARPLPKVTTEENSIFSCDETGCKLTLFNPKHGRQGHVFGFDEVMWTETTQEEMYKAAALPLVKHLFNGYNSCCFAYGATGSGKTHTMFGGGGENRGIIPRVIHEVFRRQQGNSMFSVDVCFLEIYCDEVRVLSSLKNSKLRSAQRESISEPEGNLKIFEDIEGNITIQNIKPIPVASASGAEDILSKGLKRRTSGATKLNEKSSRSHTIFTLFLNSETKQSRLDLVDLAGSERLSKTESAGQRLKEALYINTSLTTLGKVIMALDASLMSAYIPYRESKLTRILQSSLGGNAHTTIIGTVNPANDRYEESISTLHFANRCRNVVNKPRVNYKKNELKKKEAAIRRLNKEIIRLKLLFAVVLEKKNKSIRRLLEDLGHKDFKLLKDGRVKLANGKVIGSKINLSMIQNQISKFVEQSDSSFTRDGMAFMGDKLAQIGKLISDKVDENEIEEAFGDAENASLAGRCERLQETCKSLREYIQELNTENKLLVAEKAETKKKTLELEEKVRSRKSCQRSSSMTHERAFQESYRKLFEESQKKISMLQQALQETSATIQPKESQETEEEIQKKSAHDIKEKVKKAARLAGKIRKFTEKKESSFRSTVACPARHLSCCQELVMENYSRIQASCENMRINEQKKSENAYIELNNIKNSLSRTLSSAKKDRNWYTRTIYGLIKLVSNLCCGVYFLRINSGDHPGYRFKLPEKEMLNLEKIEHDLREHGLTEKQKLKLQNTVRDIRFSQRC